MHDGVVNAHTARLGVAQHPLNGPPADAEYVQGQWGFGTTDDVRLLLGCSRDKESKTNV